MQQNFDEVGMSKSEDRAHDPQAIATLTADIVSAYAARNAIPSEALSALISTVAQALSAVGSAATPAPSATPAPAVPVKKSVTPDFLICLEDGKKRKMLKRHLRSEHGLTMADYRARWSLPHDYPAVASNYATQRSSLAKSVGLGKRGAVGRPRKTAAAQAEPAAGASPPPVAGTAASVTRRGARRAPSRPAPKP